jgi:hypothetical protein
VSLTKLTVARLGADLGDGDSSTVDAALATLVAGLAVGVEQLDIDRQ